MSDGALPQWGWTPQSTTAHHMLLLLKCCLTTKVHNMLLHLSAACLQLLRKASFQIAWDRCEGQDPTDVVYEQLMSAKHTGRRIDETRGML